MMKVKTFNSTDNLINETKTLLVETLGTPGNLMLSGGSTPYVIYNQLANSPCPINPNRILFLSDERMEPFDSCRNNAKNLEPMLKALECTDQFIRVNTDLTIDNAAHRFESDLEQMEEIDLGFLGMGLDGHTAGFFTPDQARMNTGALVLYTDRPDGMQGISVTPAFLKKVKRIILLVTGESKRAIINTVQNDPQSIPAGIALSEHPNIELWTDVL